MILNINCKETIDLKHQIIKFDKKNVKPHRYSTKEKIDPSYLQLADKMH